MELTGAHLITADRHSVWQALNDPETLRQCIPGCETLEAVNETHFNALVTTKIGPVKAKFKGSVRLSDLNPPQSYRITGEGQAGPAGFAKGIALVELAEEGPHTKLIYQIDATVGGKLAQIGQRFIDVAANKLAAEFFQAFDAQFPDDQALPETMEPHEIEKGLAPSIWIGGLVAAALILLALLARL